MTQKIFSTRKIKDCQPSEKNESCPGEVLENFYNGALEKPNKKKQLSLIWFLVLTVILSFLASLTMFFLFLSGTFFDSKISTWLGIQPLTPNNIVVEKKETYNIAEEEYLTGVLKEIKPTSVGIFLQDTKNKAAYYQNSNFVGSGMIMTSDGWIVTAKSFLNTKNSYVVIDQNGKIYQVLDIKMDDTWDVAYLKIEANNLPVMSLAEFKNVNQGDRVILMAGINGLNSKIATDRIVDARLVLDKEYIRETEKNYLYFELADQKNKNMFVGAPVVNYKKEVVGIFLNKGETNYVLPASYLKKHFNMLLTLKKYTPAFLGLEYIDLAANLNQETATGVLVVNVKNNSPLYKTSITKGTIILKVGDDLLNVNNNFSNLIQEYRLGDKITLTYLDGESQHASEKTLDVEIK